MQKKILFAVDNTAQCRDAARFVLEFFAHDEYLISLVHVKSPILLYGEAAALAYSDVSQSEQDKSEKLLNEFVDLFQKGGKSVHTHLLEGEPVPTLISFAEDYDLLVIGESEQSLWNRLFKSHQSSLQNSSPVPILIVK